MPRVFQRISKIKFPKKIVKKVKEIENKGVYIMIKYLEKDNFAEEIEKGRILVDFYADWCGPCKMMGAVLETMDENILKVNVDKFPEIARQFGIMSIPTLMIFEEGKVVAKNVGFMSKEDLIEFLKQTILSCKLKSITKKI